MRIRPQPQHAPVLLATARLAPRSQLLSVPPAEGGNTPFCRHGRPPAVLMPGNTKSAEAIARLNPNAQLPRQREKNLFLAADRPNPKGFEPHLSCHSAVRSPSESPLTSRTLPRVTDGQSPGTTRARGGISRGATTRTGNMLRDEMWQVSVPLRCGARIGSRERRRREHCVPDLSHRHTGGCRAGEGRVRSPLRRAQWAMASALLAAISGESDAAPLRRRRAHELADDREHGGDGRSVCGEVLLYARSELIETSGEILVRGKALAVLAECAHGRDVHLDGARVAEDLGGAGCSRAR